MTQARVPPHPSSSWSASVRRGATLGVVAACHLGLLALMLRPVAYRESRQPVPRGTDHALRLVFIPPSTTAPAAKPSVLPPPRHQPARTPRLRRTADTPRTMVQRVATNVPSRPTTDQAAPGYHTGDFRSRLQEAQRTRTVHLPGSAAPRVSGLRLRVAPSAQDLVRQLTVATRCTAERFKMQRSKTEFITAQLMDRTLEADGCGPHADHTSTSDVVDAVTRQLMEEQP